MAPVSTVLIRPLRLQRLYYVWIHLLASEKTAVQVEGEACFHFHHIK